MQPQFAAVLHQQAPRRGDVADENERDDSDDYNDPEPTEREYEESRAKFLDLYTASVSGDAAAAAAAPAAPVRLVPPETPARRALAALVTALAATAADGKQGVVRPATLTLARDETCVVRCRQLLVQAETALKTAARAPVQQGLQRFVWTTAAAPPWPLRRGRDADTVGPAPLATIRLVMDATLMATAIGVVGPCANVLAVVGQWLFEGVNTALVLVFAGDTCALFGAAAHYPATRDWAALSADDLACAQWRYVGHTLAPAAIIDTLLVQPATTRAAPKHKK